MKRVNLRWIPFVLFLAVLCNLGLTHAQGAPTLSSSSSAAPSRRLPISPVTGLAVEAADVAVTSRPTGAIASTGWTKYAGNPVFGAGPAGSWDSSSVDLASILYSDGTYKLWYSGDSGTNASTRIGLATSPDGVNWTRYAGNPVLTVGSASAWDSGYVNVPHVIYHNGQYEMWFRGSNDPANSNFASIGYATSPDGEVWTKYAGNPVLTPGASGSWDDAELWSGYVVAEAGSYKMWYAASDGAHFQIGYATSPDGKQWTKYAGNPVLTRGSAGNWDSQLVFYPEVVRDGSPYGMYYSGYNLSAYAIGYATSTDGMVWTKYSGNPVLPTGSYGSWDSGYVFAAAVIAHPCTSRMWYTGGNPSRLYRIGQATSTTACYLVYAPLVTR
jgi:predicted GH43/DUF377 family glycosyl hydrolase